MSTLNSSSITSLCYVTHSLVHATPSLKIRSAISIPKLQDAKVLKELNKMPNTIFRKNSKPLQIDHKSTNNGTSTLPREINHVDSAKTSTIDKCYVILETVLDRIEMHQNVGEQRENWNSLLLNSLNMVTLTAATMAALASMGGPTLPLKVSATLLFLGATGILLIMNKVQPSQLVEEQRNAVRLFKQLRTKLQTTLALGTISENDVEDAMRKVLALDRAYPLPLLGAMLDKFPKTFKPALWWPNKMSKKSSSLQQKIDLKKQGRNINGWNIELEDEMREILGVIETRDKEDYVTLGNKALKLNKALAITGPTLMGIAAMGSAFSGHGGPWVGLLAAAAGSLASVVNTIEHGGQVGMVFEMYRNCAGFFELLEENVESNLKEDDLSRRENGELFEMKIALKLGRSLSELRDLATKSSVAWLTEEGSPKGEFASKLF